MTIEKAISGGFGLDDTGWTRHANPKSVWTRVPLIVPLILAVWSRDWIGWWALIPVSLVVAWTFLNPRAFGPARDDHAWSSQAVFGERFWVNRDVLEIPPHHRRIPNLLSGIAAIGAALTIYGLVVLNPWATVSGGAIAFMGKMWFVDRMAWLYQDIIRGRPELRYLGPDQPLTPLMR